MDCLLSSIGVPRQMQTQNQHNCNSRVTDLAYIAVLFHDVWFLDTTSVTDWIKNTTKKERNSHYCGEQVGTCISFKTRGYLSTSALHMCIAVQNQSFHSFIALWSAFMHVLYDSSLFKTTGRKGPSNVGYRCITLLSRQASRSSQRHRVDSWNSLHCFPCNSSCNFPAVLSAGGTLNGVEGSL